MCWIVSFKCVLLFVVDMYWFVSLICNSLSHWYVLDCVVAMCSGLLCPPLKKEGHIALHLSVGMSVSLNLVQLITQ